MTEAETLDRDDARDDRIDAIDALYRSDDLPGEKSEVEVAPRCGMARRMPKEAEDAGYFIAHGNRFELVGDEGENGFRICQLGAYWAVWSHFTTSAEPALVSLPTGSGKTALMMALAFGLKAKRVLIITPALILRDQVAAEFGSLAVLKTIGALPKNAPAPRVLSCDSKRGTTAEWNEFRSYDVVVATPKTTSPEEKDVSKPPAGLFDLLLVDEAHHTPAPTWRALVREFQHIKTVFLTATPFRRDRRRVRAPLVYHYPLGHALDRKIYRPVKYQKVEHDSNRARQDALLCDEAKRILDGENRRGNNAKVLVRTSNVAWSDRLVKLYNDRGIRVEAVDYTKSWPENKSTLDSIRAGSLDGMVCVGMVGEGLDISELKIAVLHSAPRSLPFTLQFVGRLSRTTSSQVGDAYLLAVPDEVRGEVRALYRGDSNWRRLVPALVDEVVGKVSGLKHFRSSGTLDTIDIDPLSIKPFFSVKLYRVLNPAKIELSADLDLKDDTAVCFQEIVLDDDVLMVITEQEDEPPWAKDTAISDPNLALHIYYFDATSHLMFEMSTSEIIAQDIRRSIAPDSLQEISPSALIRVMQDWTSSEYYMVGLRNAVGSGVSQPAYKTLMGSQVQASVRPIEGRTFAPGHVLARIAEDETRGIATGNSRVWAIKRDNVSEFKDWCSGLASHLRGQKPKAGPALPHLGFLARPEELTQLPERPLAVVLDDFLMLAARTFEVKGPDGKRSSSLFPLITVKGFAGGVLSCEFEFDQIERPVSLEYRLGQPREWSITDSRSVRVRAEKSDNDIFDGDLAEFLAKYPPTLVMPNGGTIIKQTYWRPEAEKSILPVDGLLSRDWSGCDLSCEDGTPEPGKKNVHASLVDILAKEVTSRGILIKDHGSNEISDYVSVEFKTKAISFFHCKATKKGRDGKPQKAGVRVEDCYEVLGQAIRNRSWVRYPDILNELVKRIEGDSRSTAIVCGKLSELQSAAKTFSSNAWTYRVVAVQPALDCEKARNGKRVNALLISTYEWLAGSGATFEVWGS